MPYVLFAASPATDNLATNPGGPPALAADLISMAQAAMTFRTGIGDPGS
jgi:hypothetical protein